MGNMAGALGSAGMGLGIIEEELRRPNGSVVGSTGLEPVTSCV